MDKKEKRRIAYLKYKENHTEALKEYAKNYKINNREKYNIYQKNYIEKRKLDNDYIEKRKLDKHEYYFKNKERIIDYNTKYYHEKVKVIKEKPKKEYFSKTEYQIVKSEIKNISNSIVLSF